MQADKPNMNNQALLTIAIPTYNRARYLDLCLKSISEEIASLDESQRRLVNVYVSDNASPDNTPDVIAQYQVNLAGTLKAVRNSQNIGPDLNFTQCYDSVNSPYVWIVGDDDVLLPGGLKMVLDILISKEVDILYVNNYWFRESHTEKPIPNRRRSTLTFRSPLEFTRHTHVMLTFISGLIVRSGIGLEYRSNLAASNLVQLSWVLPLLRDGKYFVSIENYVVAAKQANSGGYGLVKVFGINLQKIAATILKDKPDLVRAIQNGTIINFFPGFIIQFRRGTDKFEDQDMAAGLKEAFGDNWRYYALLTPLFAMPLFLSKYYYYFIVLLRRLSGTLLI